jgi:virginiamycin B lyase
MHNPATAAFATEDMPMSFSGPRRFDIDAEGMLWIPTYASNALVRFDSASNHFESFPLPNPDSAPYVARVDRTHGTVWVGTAASDEILAFDPRTREFTSYPLPTRGALIRHIAVDERRNEIWAAYGASPGLVPARIARLRPMP